MIYLAPSVFTNMAQSNHDQSFCYADIAGAREEDQAIVDDCYEARAKLDMPPQIRVSGMHHLPNPISYPEYSRVRRSQNPP